MSDKIEEEDRKKRRTPTPSPKRSTHPKNLNCGGESYEEKAILLQSYHLLKQQGVKSEMLLDASADIITIRNEVDRMRTALNSENV